MELDSDQIARLREELTAVTRMAFTRGLSSGISGNTSARVPGNPGVVLIKATGKCFGEVNPEDFVPVDLAGNPLSDSGKPSKEVKFHCGIYRERPEVGAVFHGHSAYTTAYVVAKGDLPLVTAAARGLIGEVEVVDFAPAGSDALAAMVVAAFKGSTCKCCVLKTHGFVAAAADIAKAFYLGDVLEDNAKVASIMASYK
ncbi:MAG: class II aldolase/adducin family protein [Planctomycetota bacterium]|jgi:L-fuculose-phosphate aldolase|nr:class II aldolase/adducin family protein [Planctomycetota bacterium]